MSSTESALSFPAVVPAHPSARNQQVAHIVSVGQRFRHQPEVLPGIDEPSLLFDFSETYAADVLSRSRLYKLLVETGMDLGTVAGVFGLKACGRKKPVASG